MSSEKCINITKYIKRLCSVPQKIDHFEIFKKLIGTLYELNFISFPGLLKSSGDEFELAICHKFPETSNFFRHMKMK